MIDHGSFFNVSTDYSKFSKNWKTFYKNYSLYLSDEKKTNHHGKNHSLRFHSRSKNYYEKLLLEISLLETVAKQTTKRYDFKKVHFL